MAPGAMAPPWLEAALTIPLAVIAGLGAGYAGAPK